MLRLELDRLKHRDVRQRRMAVRRLFEIDDSAALSSFVEMLDSDDEWFVDKSVDAIRRWVGAEHRKLVVQLSVRKEERLRLLSAEISTRIGTEALPILSTLCMDSESTVRREAWRSRLSIDPGTIPVAIESEDHVVRKTAISHSGDVVFLEKMLHDQHPRVREAALDQMISIGHIPNIVDEMVDDRLRLKLAKLLLPKMLDSEDVTSIASLCLNPTPSLRKVLAEALENTDWLEWSEVIDAAKNSSDNLLLPRLLRSKKGPIADGIRFELLQQAEDGTRVRILEHLHGRNVSKSIMEILPNLCENENPLVAQAATSLLKDSATLESEI